MRRPVVVAVALVIVGLLPACGGGGKQGGSTTKKPASAAGAGKPRTSLFAADSIWNRRLPGDAPLDPRNTALMRAFKDEIAREQKASTGPWIQTTEYSVPVYTVPRDQRRVRVVLDVHQAYGKTLRRTLLDGVPLPKRAKPAEGTDGHLTVLQPSTDSMWEFWRLRREGGAWHAAWGGAMHGVSRSRGFFTDRSWPGGQSYWGATATSLPLLGGLIRIGELRRGRIDHAIAIAIPDARAKVVAWPAQRTDGNLTSADALPEGAHLRLDPKLDIDALHLPPVAHAIAVAAQRYGMVVRDITHHATAIYAEDPRPTGHNPYPELFDGKTAGEVLAKFPWDHMQLLRMRLRHAG